MKKYIGHMMVFAAMITMGLTGCSEKGHVEVDTDHHEVLEDAPQWVLKPESKDLVVGLGSSRFKEDVTFQFQREEAMNNARADLAKKIISDFKNDTRSSYTQGGTEDIGETRRFSSVNHNVSETVLRGSKQVNIWISPENGELFMLVGIAPENIEYPIQEQDVPQEESVAAYSNNPQLMAENVVRPVEPVQFPIPILDDNKPVVTF